MVRSSITGRARGAYTSPLFREKLLKSMFCPPACYSNPTTDIIKLIWDKTDVSEKKLKENEFIKN